MLPPLAIGVVPVPAVPLESFVLGVPLPPPGALLEPPTAVGSSPVEMARPEQARMPSPKDKQADLFLNRCWVDTTPNVPRHPHPGK